jgi:hypothetical protein
MTFFTLRYICSLFQFRFTKKKKIRKKQISDREVKKGKKKK